MPTKAESSRERRWVIVAPDGRYVSLGRHGDPSEQEITEAEKALRVQGLSGWLAVMEGNPWVGKMPKFLEVRPLAEPTTAFSDAVAACIAKILEKRSTAKK
ncbi:hypothetical protein GXW71_17290 [Roseomonas hellenica]|uniref:Uncharacterized protein n=1 Tax=Plastoroseomonas hellenica TaxID=2687306 RepID=A0ABS5F0P3_9PROT|nr:hypothetical protein [Plastoroseomonas hellenica]MBR0666118.1 hypothetical protein [Plastoroseomonas hellenica]